MVQSPASQYSHQHHDTVTSNMIQWPVTSMRYRDQFHHRMINITLHSPATWYSDLVIGHTLQLAQLQLFDDIFMIGWLFNGTSTQNGQFVSTAGQGNWLGWLRMANEIQRILPYVTRNQCNTVPGLIPDRLGGTNIPPRQFQCPLIIFQNKSLSYLVLHMCYSIFMAWCPCQWCHSTLIFMAWCPCQWCHSTLMVKSHLQLFWLLCVVTKKWRTLTRHATKIQKHLLI